MEEESKKEIDNYIYSLDNFSYKCLMSYISIPNIPDISPEIFNLLDTFGSNKVKNISEDLDKIRIKYNLKYEDLQNYILLNYD